ncbi:MAG: hypothetical protein QXG03_03475, partial [Halalkalicoccus sp.]
MGSVSISHLVIFIASLLVAASVAGTLIAGVEEVSSSVDRQSEEMTTQIDTDIAIISDPASDAIYDDGGDGDPTVSLYVKNTGENALDADDPEIDVLLDGQYQSTLDVAVVSGGDRWSSGAVAELTVTLDSELDAGDHRVTVIAHGNRDTFK